MASLAGSLLQVCMIYLLSDISLIFYYSSLLPSSYYYLSLVLSFADAIISTFLRFGSSHPRAHVYCPIQTIDGRSSESHKFDWKITAAEFEWKFGG